jgi:hypothetical protein
MNQDQTKSYIEIRLEKYSQVLKNDRGWDTRLLRDALNERCLVAVQALAPYADQPVAQEALAYVLKREILSDKICLLAAEALAPYADQAVAQEALVYALKNWAGKIGLVAAKALARYADQPVAQEALAAKVLKRETLDDVARF